MRRCN